MLPGDKRHSMELQLTCENGEIPTPSDEKPLNSFNDLLSLKYEDIQIDNYDPYPDIKNKPGMAV